MMKTILLVTLCIALCASTTLKASTNKRKHSQEETLNNRTQTASGSEQYLREQEEAKYEKGNSMCTSDVIVYQDIFSAIQNNAIKKHGNPTGWDESTYAVNKWNGFRILNIGNGVQTNQDGLLINVPTGYNVLWFRVLNDRWTTFRIRHQNTTNQVNFREEESEVYACGYRKLNEIAPGCAASEAYWNLHTWCQIPIRKPGPHIVHSDQQSVGWISGVAFSKNLWSHALNSAVAYHWSLNGGTDVAWHTPDWNNDQLAGLNLGKIWTLRVPVIPNGKDKLLYIAEHDSNWVGTMHGEVQVNGHRIERFRTSFRNPFATHFNSKLYDRYMATLVPASIIPADSKFLNLVVDMTNQNWNVHFREIGTHDYQ